MRRKALTHHLLDFRLQVFRALHAGLQHDDRLDDLGALRVWLADDRDFRHRGMLHNHAFDVERTDAVAGRSDDVVVTTDEEEMTVLVAHHRVAGDVPVAADVGRFRFPVAGEGVHRRARNVDREHARRVRRLQVQIVVEDRHFEARQGPAA